MKTILKLTRNRVCIIAALLGLMLVAMKVAADPNSWRWMFPHQAVKESPAKAAKKKGGAKKKAAPKKKAAAKKKTTANSHFDSSPGSLYFSGSVLLASVRFL